MLNIKIKKVNMEVKKGKYYVTGRYIVKALEEPNGSGSKNCFNAKLIFVINAISEVEFIGKVGQEMTFSANCCREFTPSDFNELILTSEGIEELYNYSSEKLSENSKLIIPDNWILNRTIDNTEKQTADNTEKQTAHKLGEGQNITRTDLKEIFYVLSLNWQTRIYKAISNISVFEENIFIPKKLIEDLVKDSNEKQLNIIKKFLIMPEDLSKMILDNINSFENACSFLGKNRIELLGHFKNIPSTPSIRRQINLAKLEVIVEALNGGWTMPDIKEGDKSETKFVVTFDHSTKKHIVEAIHTFLSVPTSLVLKEQYLAEHLIKIIEKENINFFSEI